MNSTTDLPTEVINAIQAGHKIEAIKLLRDARGLGLKEAKHAVDAYLRAHPSLRPPKSGSGGFGFVVFLLALAFLAYQLLK